MKNYMWLLSFDEYGTPYEDYSFPIGVFKNKGDAEKEGKLLEKYAYEYAKEDEREVYPIIEINKILVHT